MFEKTHTNHVHVYCEVENSDSSPIKIRTLTYPLHKLCELNYVTASGLQYITLIILFCGCPMVTVSTAISESSAMLMPCKNGGAVPSTVSGRTRLLLLLKVRVPGAGDTDLQITRQV